MRWVEALITESDDSKREGFVAADVAPRASPWCVQGSVFRAGRRIKEEGGKGEGEIIKFL